MTTPADTERLLVLDDTVEVAELIGELAEQAGFDATVTSDIDAFNVALEHEAPSVIVLDLQMPETDGIEVLRQLAAAACTARILLISGMDQQTIVSAERFARQKGLKLLGAVQKPFEPAALVDFLSQARGLTGQLAAEDLARAIDEAHLLLRYQPVVRHLGPQTWHAESVEALPRWHHPEFGVLTPGQFIPLISSERSVLMQQLTDYVLQQGAEQLRQWQSTGLHLGLRVNVPAGLISDTGFPDRLERLLDTQSVDPALLTLELTDLSALVHSSDGIEILTRLRLKGINVSLDDFGANSADLQSLYTLPITEVKLDPSLTADLTHEQRAGILLRGMLAILKELNIECCAEGVESSEQMAALEALQCDLIQGFYIGTPMPAPEIPKALVSWSADATRQLGASV